MFKNNATFRHDNQENNVFRVYACQWLGPSVIGKVYGKNGAMLHYIKGALRTPAECMQIGTLKRRTKWMSYYCSQTSAASHVLKLDFLIDKTPVKLQL